MILENKLNITNQVELARAEEKISKQKAKQLYDSGDISQAQVGTFARGAAHRGKRQETRSQGKKGTQETQVMNPF